MIARMVCHARLGKKAPGVYVAVYRSGRRLMPGNVESRQFGKERQIAVWQMIMDPPSQRLPVTRSLEVIHEWSNYNTSGCTFVSVCILAIPNMPGKVRFIARAVVFLFVPALVDFT